MEEIPTAFVPKHLRVIIIGAGISGIQSVKDVVTRLPKVRVTVYEKNQDVGGTWFENRYPGCSCDVPSHTYQYSWNPNPRWSQLYAAAPEILQYLRSTVEKHGLRQYIEFGTMCRSAIWHEDKSQWLVTLENIQNSSTLREEWCDVLIYAVGRLNNWKLPNISGIDKFKGRVMHTADWPEEFDPRGKDIAVIGNGASAVQCLAKICSDARSVDNFIRGPTWLVPHVFSENGESQITYSQDIMERHESDEKAYFEFRLKIEQKLASSFGGLWRDSPAAKKFHLTASEHMARSINSPENLEALLPGFAAGCRRFTPADAYMKALNQPNVQLRTSPITHADHFAIYTTEGKRHSYDAIVCATGFDPYSPRFPIIGRAGSDLSALWSKDGGYESYMAAAVAGFPNFFVFNPPTCPVNGSAYPGIERASDYMMRAIARMQTDGIKSICVKHSAQSAFNRWVQSRMSTMVWSDKCSSWYKTSDGKVIVPWPGTILHYYAATEIMRWEDYDLRFEDELQKYSSFGNGITTEGFTPDALPWLIRPHITTNR